MEEVAGSPHARRTRHPHCNLLHTPPEGGSGDCLEGCESHNDPCCAIVDGGYDDHGFGYDHANASHGACVEVNMEVTYADSCEAEYTRMIDDGTSETLMTADDGVGGLMIASSSPATGCRTGAVQGSDCLRAHHL